jgi:hypothetical protein
MMQRLCLIGMCSLMCLLSKAQLLINEVSASCNTVIIADDNANNQDWIEIYNPTAGPVNASGFFITDNVLTPLKWQLPNVTIGPNGFMRVFCSGENRVSGVYYHSNFKLDRAGDQIYIFNSSSVQVDNLIYGNLDQNHSFGRSPDGSATTGIFTAPTPNASNTGTIATGYCPPVVFSLNRGFYSGAQSLSLTCPGYTIRYTINGSEPTGSSSLYVAAISINTAVVVKAKAFPVSGPVIPGLTLTRSYFINETQMGYIPIVSISMNQTDFNTIWNTTNYSSNYYPEKIGHIEFFKNRTKFAFESDINLKLHGTTSTSWLSQKSMRLTNESEYNNPSIKDTLFPVDKPTVKKFDGFNLRHDQGGGGIWDPYATQLASKLNVDYLAYRPCIVFVNGQYYGEYGLREIGSEDYIEVNHPTMVNKDSLDLLRQNYDWSTSTNSLVALEGSDTAFFNHLNQINTITPNTQIFYNYFRSKFDEKSFFDYFISQIYVGNTDWGGYNGNPINNTKIWRSHRPGAKWRYILYDCDYSIGIQTPSTDIMPSLLSPSAINYSGQLFKRVTMNSTYKTYFINRFADLLNTHYQPASAQLIGYTMRDSLDAVIQRHLLRWGSTTYPQWQGFWTTYWGGSAAPRLLQLRNHIQTDFAMTAQVTTTFEVYPAGAGTVMLNTIQPPTYPWSGVYYNGAPITIKSKAATGYVFDHWESTDLGMNNQVDSNTFNLNSSQVIKLFFASNVGIKTNAVVDDNVSVFPNPAGDQLFISAKGDEVKRISLYNSTGALIRQKEVEGISSYEDVSEMITDISAGVYIAVVETGKGRYHKKLVLNGN